MTRPNHLEIAIYLRKSRADMETEREAEARGQFFDTLTKHRNELLSVAERDQHHILDLFEEVVSGEFITERPEMQQLLHNVRNMKYDAVLVMDIDRLGRGDKMDQGRIERAFKQSQTLILTPAEVYDLNDESGEFNVEVRTFLSRFEYKKIKKRLQSGRVRSAQEGKDVGRKPPYGYSKDPDKRLHVNDGEAAIVRLIYQWCLQGNGRVQIARKLTELGIPSPSGKSEWSHATVRKILANPKYKGDQVYGRVRWTKQEDGSYHTRVVKDPAQYTTSAGAHEPIVDAATWMKVQQALSDRSTAPVKQHLDIVNPFAGILRCKKCGNAMLANNPSKRPNKYVYCGTRGCRQKMIALSKLEHTVLNVLTPIFTAVQPNLHQQHPDAASASAQLLEKRITKLKSELQRAHKQADRLHDLLEDGTYDHATFVERKAKLQEKTIELEQDLRRAEELWAAENHSFDSYRSIVCINAGALYQNTASIRDQNAILKSFIKEIRYNREPDWKDAYQFELEIELYE